MGPSRLLELHLVGRLNRSPLHYKLECVRISSHFGRFLLFLHQENESSELKGKYRLQAVDPCGIL